MDIPPSDPKPPEDAGEVYGPEPWRPVERRTFVRACTAMITGGILGYAGYPLFNDQRRRQFLADMEQQWDSLTSPRQRKRPRSRQDTDDIHEARRYAGASSREIPVVLDAEGKAYEAFLVGLNLKHIKPIEMIRPHFKCRGEVVNQLPPRALWKNIASTLKVADALRDELGVRLLNINSAYRSPAYNAACPGAASHSFHTQNMALDLVYDCPPAKVAEAANALRNRGLFKGGIGLYSSFTHIDTRGKNANWGQKLPAAAPVKLASSKAS